MIAGRYSLDREIGRGGMGAVWLGRDEVLGRPVALKRVGTALAGAGPDRERAEREARLAARLNHPNVVAVFDLADEGDGRWLVMEYVEGTNLAELIRANGSLPPDQVAPILAQAASALAAAHAASIVHRDVKPSNILVTAEGGVKLSDFGIARTDSDASLTQTGLVTGSPAYLSPEVASGRTATGATDMWSLGATLFHAVTGEPPYQVGDNVLGALYRIVHEDPPRTGSAGWLSPLLEATMTQNPADRWDAETARQFLEAGPGAAAPRRPPRLRSVPAVMEPQGTQVMRAVPPPPPPPDAVAAEAPRRRRAPAWVPVAAGLAVIVVLTVVAFVIGLGNDDRDDVAGDPGTSESADPSPSAPTTAPEPDAADMESFVGTYLQTAASEPERAFALLTSGFQDESGGLDGYEGFWGDVEEVRLEQVSADPASLEVTYTYEYRTGPGPSGTETDTVTLQLEFVDGGYLIADELR